MRKYFLSLAYALLLLASCATGDNKPQSFYDIHSGWDIVHIPVIEPYLASSIDGGGSWYIDGNVNGESIRTGENTWGAIYVTEFGVSGNYIFGRGEELWFLFDTRSKMYARYDTREELLQSLSDLSIPLTPVKSCKEYSDMIGKGGKCYWFPVEGEAYKAYIDVKPKEIFDIVVTNDTVNGAKLDVKQSIGFQRNHIYFFRVKLNGNESDLLHLGINYAAPFRVENDKLIPVFIEAQNFDITLYTPFTIAKEKGVPENRRLHTSKNVMVKMSVN